MTNKPYLPKEKQPKPPKIMVGAHVTYQMKYALDALAEQRQVPLAQMIRKLLSNHLQESADEIRQII